MEGHKNMGEKREILDSIVIGGVGEQEIKINSVGDNIGGGASGAEPDSSLGGSSKRRKSRRHNNVYQIQEFEAIFKENPHPDEKVRLEIETKLSMNSNQVKSWFQNRRTREQLQWKRHENEMLKQENDKLRIEQIILKEAIPICKRCNNGKTIGDVTILRRINGFHDEKFWIELVAERNDFGDDASTMWIDFGNGLSSPLSAISLRPTISLANKDITNDKSKLMNLGFAAMNELLKLAHIGEPLWVRSLDGGGETLNLEEYARSITPVFGIKPAHFTTEATRASSIVINNTQTIVETLMDTSEWVNMFSCIIGNTSTIDVISTGINGNRSDTLLLIKAELQIISELAPVREIKFLRFCKKYAEGTWAIVDVSIDTVQEGSQQCETDNCRRLPSGCIVQDMTNGYSKIIWIEHMEYNENSVHPLYRPLVKSGLGFGAQRWMATLQRQSEFSQMMMSSIDPTRSLLVYATIDPLKMHVVKNGGDSSWVALLPYRIAIVPDCFQDFSKANNCNEISEKNDNGFCSGSLVTIGFQILVNNLPATKFSMESAKKANILISRMIHSIKTAFNCK
ncbi:hypothetical protein HAX54_051458 [Datura stramonium]|uniref:Uncharacterized protein n=1 Tax=Datura stramonium TaxID=4076 RepID=A0ABS8SZC2_DATST|nr:hypothetical protein [Datura stramonium]